MIEHSKDFSSFKTQLKLTWYNRNLVGTAFGGSIYSMCDPFFMFILIIQLGEDYIVWDKSASIDFVKLGQGTVYAEFRLEKEQLDKVNKVVDERGKHVFEFQCEVRDKEGLLFQKLKKGLYVRWKDFAQQKS